MIDSATSRSVGIAADYFDWGRQAVRLATVELRGHPLELRFYEMPPALVTALSQGVTTLLVLGLGLATALVPTFVSWLVGLYLLKMDPMVLAGAVAGARNSTTAMRAISDEAKSNVPSFGYPVPYALSTVVFLIYGYLAMVLS